LTPAASSRLRLVTRRGDVLHLKRRGDIDAAADRSVDRTVVGVDAVRAFCRRALLGLQPQLVGDMDPANDEDVAVFLDLARRL